MAHGSRCEPIAPNADITQRDRQLTSGRQENPGCVEGTPGWSEDESLEEQVYCGAVMHKRLTRFPLASTTGKLFRLLHFNASIAFSALTSCGNVSTFLHAECISESRI
jgi:hypothetical protein